MAPGSYTPIFEIHYGDRNVTDNFLNRATSINVELASGNGAQDTCTITCDDRDWLVATPHVGDTLSVYLGYKEVGISYMGTFEVDEVNFSFIPKQIQIHGNSISFNSAIKSPTIKNFDGKTVKEILEEYGKDLNLSVVVDSEIGSKRVPYKNGTASPMHVIGELEKMYDGVAKISNGRLSFAEKDSGLSASGQEIPMVRLLASHIANCQVRHLNRHDYTKTVARYRDKDTNRDVEVTAKSAVNGILGQGEVGGERPYTVKNMFNSQGEAQAAADSQMKSLDRKLGEGVFELAAGDPWIRDHNRILVVGCRDGIDGSYVADVVSHTFTKDGGLRTSIRTQAVGDGTSFGLLYEQAPGDVLAPGPGQITGDVLPK